MKNVDLSCAERGAKNGSNPNLRLSDLWPTPNWKRWCMDGRDPEVLAHLAMLYQGFRTSPHIEGTAAISSEDWRVAYRSSIRAMCRLFKETLSVADIQTIHDRFCAILEIEASEASVVSGDIRKNIAYWALANMIDGRVASPFVLTLHGTSLAKWLPKMGWPDQACGLLEVPIVPVQMRDGSWRVAHIEGEYFTYLDADVLDEAEAIKEAKRRIQLSQERTAIRTKETGGMLRRDGAGGRPRTRNIREEELQARFGLRSVLFGRGLEGCDWQVGLNESYDALSDLATLTGFKPVWIGLGGLSMTICDERTEGAMPHYAPLLRTISFNRGSNSNSLCHDWAHALDHRIAKTLSLLTGGYASAIIDRMSADETHTKKQRDLIVALQQIRKYSLTDYGAVGEQSDFLKAATKITRSYRTGQNWNLPEEMFARGFESFVQDTLECRGVRNPWLARNTKSEDFDTSILRGPPYPVGEERRILNTNYAALLGALMAA